MAKITKTIKVEVEICDFCGEEITGDNSVYEVLRDDRIICEDCANNDYFSCTQCGDYFLLEQNVGHWALGYDRYCPKCSTQIAHEILEMVKDIETEG